ncbi:glycosyltransferase [Streptomyces sp. TS71-3]|uniref:MGDG synthase family glycosyltransferase n=1 Tax=Streptomyces sp. TS71-3 TaxID=2733862 RepID=UPI001B21E9C2|nr:glycosyltransferase [Streptomyces sp. TS71-3]GHJ36695.1 hypothetical protein Sm713_23040 [Streptomyces sp. TS71-3]
MVRFGSTVDPGAAPPAAPGPARTAHRVVIVSASMGAGHDGAAAELARRISAAGTEVVRYDLLDLLPARLGRAVCDGYHRLLDHAPWVYQRIYQGAERAGGSGPLARTLLRATENRLLRALPDGTGAVVSTYPGASRILGSLRLDGRLTVPVLTYLTDFSVHPFWVAPGVDTHLAAHAVPAGQARALGARDVRICGPVTGPRFRPGEPAERRAARERFGLPADAPLALLVAGSWGVGSLHEAAAEIRATGAALPVVLCGRNTALAERLRADGIEHAFGWTDDMPGLMHAADVLVQNAGGLTSLEALATGLPVVSYRCIPGHGLTNAAALDEAGVAAWVHAPDELGRTLAAVLDGSLGERQHRAGQALFTPRDGGPEEAIIGACGGAGAGPRRTDGVAVSSRLPAGGGSCAVPRAPHQGRAPSRPVLGLPPAGGGEAAVPVVVPSGGSVVPPGGAAAPGSARRRPAGRPGRVRPVLVMRRFAVTVAVACAVSVGGVGAGFASVHHSAGLLHAIDHHLDPDDFHLHGKGPRP